jgi:signal transduction histidine kinase
MATNPPRRNAPPSDRKDAKRTPRAGWWLAIAVALLALNYLAASRATRGPALVRVPYSPFFVRQIAIGNVAEITSKGTALQGAFKHAARYHGSAATTRFRTEIPEFADTQVLARSLARAGVVSTRSRCRRACHGGRTFSSTSGRRCSSGVVSTVASPIFVEGRLWGVVSVSYDKQLPLEAEERLEKFCELIATAIGNAESSAELAASRRRIVAATDEARRRIERDLHDGIQQRLIALTFRARAMTRKSPDELPAIARKLAEDLKEVSGELREVSRGIHPTILTEAGLGPALRALARRSNVPIDIDVELDERLPAPIETAAYYIAS